MIKLSGSHSCFIMLANEIKIFLALESLQIENAVAFK